MSDTPSRGAVPWAATLDILCKVVDNYGDIGVVYRLARALSAVEPRFKLRLLVDDLAAFHELCPAIDPGLEVQRLGDWTVLRWDSRWEGLRRAPPRLVLECFASGRPDYFEELLFDSSDSEPRLIVSVEHLTAEPWALEFHRLPSATRSGLVRKSLFMPGFEAGTGGLILDPEFRAARSRWSSVADRPAMRRTLSNKIGLALPPGGEARFWVTVFSYERNYSKIVADLARFDRERPLLVLAAAGRSLPPLVQAWAAAGRPFPLVELPFLPQENWDEVLLASDFAIVRGEDSLTRAALGALPFLWQAYLQDQAHHLVKVKALLDRMRALFDAGLFSAYEALSLSINDRARDEASAGGGEELLPLLRRIEELRPGFAAFSAELLALGDLAEHLVTFLGDFG